ASCAPRQGKPVVRGWGALAWASRRHVSPPLSLRKPPTGEVPTYTTRGSLAWNAIDHTSCSFGKSSRSHRSPRSVVRYGPSLVPVYMTSGFVGCTVLGGALSGFQ